MDQEILSIILTVSLLSLVVFLIYLNNSKRFSSKIKVRIWNDMLEIEKLVKTKNPLTYRDIIIRSDQILSKSLQLRFNNQNTCGENLKKAKDIFEKNTYNKIWEVHKLRNEIIHENSEPTYSQVLDGYNIMKNAVNKILYA
jgi:hypothetical protein